jgi:hypothetical protein
MSHYHPQVEVLYNSRLITVDKGIVELLRLIWNEGYNTYNSCQDNNGIIWIQLSSVEEFRDILQKAHTYDLKINGDVFIQDMLKLKVLDQLFMMF